MKIDDTIRLSDVDLIAAVARLAEGERGATALLIAYLAELYGRRLHERAGYGSLFTYCVEVLRLSESAAYDRMKAAKVARRYPAVLLMLHDGRVNLTTVRLVAPHLTRANHLELLTEVTGRTKREVQEILARHFPQPDVVPSVRKLPISDRAPEVVPAPSAVAAQVVANDPPSTTVEPAQLATRTVSSSSHAELATPLSPDRYRIAFTAGASLREKLEMAQDLLRHALPGGDPAAVVERGLDLLLDDLLKRKFAVTERPRPSRRQAEGSRHIPAEVKRTVYLRDRGACGYVAPDGHRCGARGFLEFHHVQPYAAHGRPTEDNISLRCRVHNAYEADVFFRPAREYGGVTTTERHVPRERVSAHTFSCWNETRQVEPEPRADAALPILWMNRPAG